MSWEQARSARLENEYVLLRPIVAADRDQFHAIAFDPDTWRYFVGRIDTEEDLDRWIGDAVADIAAGRRVAFAVISKAANAIAGSMSYGNMDEKNKRIEIGWSWLGTPYRGAGINRWAKFLLLEYAFETLECERVEFKTDILNLQARKGLLNIGATEEGVLRSYNYMPDNRRRDAIFYSILAREWPGVKNQLRVHDKIKAGA